MTLQRSPPEIPVPWMWHLLIRQPDTDETPLSRAEKWIAVRDGIRPYPQPQPKDQQ